MAKKQVKTEEVSAPETVVETVAEVVKPSVADTELQELTALLADHHNAPPDYLSFVLDKANHLSKYSPSVQLAVLMMRSDFNVPSPPADPDNPDKVFAVGDTIFASK